MIKTEDIYIALYKAYKASDLTYAEIEAEVWPEKETDCPGQLMGSYIRPTVKTHIPDLELVVAIANVLQSNVLSNVFRFSAPETNESVDSLLHLSNVKSGELSLEWIKAHEDRIYTRNEKDTLKAKNHEKRVLADQIDTAIEKLPEGSQALSASDLT